MEATPTPSATYFQMKQRQRLFKPLTEIPVHWKHSRDWNWGLTLGQALCCASSCFLPNHLSLSPCRHGSGHPIYWGFPRGWTAADRRRPHVLPGGLPDSAEVSVGPFLALGSPAGSRARVPACSGDCHAASGRPSTPRGAQGWGEDPCPPREPIRARGSPSSLIR